MQTFWIPVTLELTTFSKEPLLITAETWIRGASAYTTTLRGYRGQLVLIPSGFIDNMVPYMDSFALNTPGDDETKNGLWNWLEHGPKAWLTVGVVLTLVGTVAVLLHTNLFVGFMIANTCPNFVVYDQAGRFDYCIRNSPWRCCSRSAFTGRVLPYH